jgi:hypothetical protein
MTLRQFPLNFFRPQRLSPILFGKYTHSFTFTTMLIINVIKQTVRDLTVESPFVSTLMELALNCCALEDASF